MTAGTAAGGMFDSAGADAGATEPVTGAAATGVTPKSGPEAGSCLTSADAFEASSVLLCFCSASFFSRSWRFTLSSLSSSLSGRRNLSGTPLAASEPSPTHVPSS